MRGARVIFAHPGQKTEGSEFIIDLDRVVGVGKYWEEVVPITETEQEKTNRLQAGMDELEYVNNPDYCTVTMYDGNRTAIRCPVEKMQIAVFGELRYITDLTQNTSLVEELLK